VDENEQTIKERGFRGLANISDGFSNKVRDYKERNSKNFLKEIQCSPAIPT
jgi:hypothetical protein